MSASDKTLNETKFNDHNRRKLEVRDMKCRDNERSLSHSYVEVYNFDLQKVLTTPKSNVSDFYYSRKLATYNFSMYNLVSKKATCYMWDETMAKRGSSEIASFVFQNNISLGVKDEIIYDSDSCTGQQRNLPFSIMCLYSVNNLPIKQITHNYFERGHSQMEGDSVHAVIEKATKHSELYTPAEWMTAVANAKQSMPRYKVIEVSNNLI
jgi:hypothetical protein